jgi:hypothetical protein
MGGPLPAHDEESITLEELHPGMDVEMFDGFVQTWRGVERGMGVAGKQVWQGLRARLVKS